MSSGPFDPGQSPLRGVNMEKMMSGISITAQCCAEVT